MQVIKLSAFASGFPYRYSSDDQEIRVLLHEREPGTAGLRTGDPEGPSLVWRPCSRDFEAQGVRLPPAVGVASFAAFLALIKKQKQLTGVHWFGHGTRTALLFGGGVQFSIDDVRKLKDTDVSKHFVRDGGITFFACNSGQSTDFIQALANGLGVPIRAFERRVEWVLEFSGEAPKRHITYRGVAGHRLPEPTIVKYPQASSTKK